MLAIPDFSYSPASCGFSTYEIAAWTFSSSGGAENTQGGGAAPTVRISADGKHVEYSSASEGTHNFNLVVHGEGGATRSYASQITVNGCSKVQITSAAAPAGWLASRYDIDAGRGEAPGYMKVIPIPDFVYSDAVCGYKNYFITGASKEAVTLDLVAKTLAYSAAVDKVFSFNLNVRAVGEESVSFATTITVEKCPTNNVISSPAAGGYRAQVDYDVSAQIRGEVTIEIPDFEYSDAACPWAKYELTGTAVADGDVRLEGTKQIIYSTAADKKLTFSLIVTSVGGVKKTIPSEIRVYGCLSTTKIMIPVSNGYQPVDQVDSPTRARLINGEGGMTKDIEPFSYDPPTCDLQGYQVSGPDVDAGRVSISGIRLSYDTAVDGILNFNLIVKSLGGATSTIPSTLWINGCKDDTTISPNGYMPTYKYKVPRARTSQETGTSGTVSESWHTQPIPDFDYSDPACGWKSYSVTGTDADVISISGKSMTYPVATDRIINFNLVVVAWGGSTLTIPSTIDVEKCGVTATTTKIIQDRPAAGWYRARFTDSACGGAPAGSAVDGGAGKFDQDKNEVIPWTLPLCDELCTENDQCWTFQFVAATATEASGCTIYTKPLSAACAPASGPALLGVPACARDQCTESPLAGSTIYQKEVFERQLAVTEPTRQIMTYDIPDFKLVDAPDGCGFNEYMLRVLGPDELTDEDAKRRARLNPIG